MSAATIKPRTTRPTTIEAKSIRAISIPPTMSMALTLSAGPRQHGEFVNRSRVVARTSSNVQLDLRKPGGSRYPPCENHAPCRACTNGET